MMTSAIPLAAQSASEMDMYNLGTPASSTVGMSSWHQARRGGRGRRGWARRPDVAVSAPAAPQTTTSASVLRRVACRGSALPWRRKRRDLAKDGLLSRLHRGDVAGYLL